MLWAKEIFLFFDSNIRVENLFLAHNISSSLKGAANPAKKTGKKAGSLPGLFSIPKNRFFLIKFLFC
jgi:hypothetical protein